MAYRDRPRSSHPTSNCRRRHNRRGIRSGRSRHRACRCTSAARRRNRDECSTESRRRLRCRKQTGHLRVAHPSLRRQPNRSCQHYPSCRRRFLSCRHCPRLRHRRSRCCCTQRPRSVPRSQSSSSWPRVKQSACLQFWLTLCQRRTRIQRALRARTDELRMRNCGYETRRLVPIDAVEPGMRRCSARSTSTGSARTCDSPNPAPPAPQALG